MRAPAQTFRRARRLRRDMSLPEILLWQDLRKGALAGARFRRQHSVGPYILDFFCPAANLALEVDGSGHDHPDRAAHDIARDAWLNGQGIRVVRVEARIILKDTDRAAFLYELETLLRSGRPD